MEYYYKMDGREQINLIQQILFLKGYSWIMSGKSLLFTNAEGPYWIKIKPESKIICCTCFDDIFRSMDFNELLDLIESDVI